MFLIKFMRFTSGNRGRGPAQRGGHLAVAKLNGTREAGAQLLGLLVARSQELSLKPGRRKFYT